jgi:hypothetical protein
LGVEIGLPVVVDDVGGVLGVAGLLTEEPSVSNGSITATVGKGYHRGDGFFLCAS